jgi:drug/metabolite transporter (DMT)-like permease
MNPGTLGREIRKPLTFLLAGALAISFAPILVRLSEIGPSATAFQRLFLALPALWLWLALAPGEPQRQRRPTGARDFALLSLAGLFFACDLAFWHWSIRLTSVANATLLANFAPIFVTLGSLLIFAERFRARFFLGLAVALAGLVLLMGDSAGLGQRHLLGDALGLITAFFYGAYILTVGRLRARFSTATVMAWSGGVAAALLVPVVLISGESLLATSAVGWAVLVGLALGSHLGGQGLIAFSLAHLPAAFSSLVLLLQPAASALLAWILLAEPLGAWQAAGGAVILFGILLARPERSGE